MPNYKKGKIVKGNVTGIESYGIFVTLDEYYKGLIHISEISNKFVSNISELFTIGETIFAKVLEVDEELFQVKLSIKNIDHKLDGKRVRKPLQETGLGFEPLEAKLDDFIKQKLVDIENDK